MNHKFHEIKKKKKRKKKRILRYIDKKKYKYILQASEFLSTLMKKMLIMELKKMSVLVMVMMQT